MCKQGDQTYHWRPIDRPLSERARSYGVTRRSGFLLRSGCDSGHYQVAHGTTLVHNKTRMPHRNLVACLVRMIQRAHSVFWWWTNPNIPLLLNRVWTGARNHCLLCIALGQRCSGPWSVVCRLRFLANETVIYGKWNTTQHNTTQRKQSPPTKHHTHNRFKTTASQRNHRFFTEAALPRFWLPKQSHRLHTTRQNTTQHSTAQHNTTQHNTTRVPSSPTCM